MRYYICIVSAGGNPVKMAPEAFTAGVRIINMLFIACLLYTSFHQAIHDGFIRGWEEKRTADTDIEVELKKRILKGAVSMKYHLTGRCLLRLFEGGIPCGAFSPDAHLERIQIKNTNFL